MRNRTKSESISGKYYRYNIDGAVVEEASPSNNIFRDDCQDEDQNFGGSNPLLITHWKNDVEPYSGWNKFNNTGGVVKVNNRCSNVPLASNIGLWVPNLKSVSVVDLLGRTAPNKPLVDLPSFLFELKDLPGMLNQVGRIGKELPHAIRLIRHGMGQQLFGKGKYYSSDQSLASLNLSLNMGWSPLVADLVKLLGVADAVQKRLDDLTKLQGGGTIRKRISVDETHTTSFSATNRLLWLYKGFSVYGQSQYTTEARRWATVRWSYWPSARPLVPPTNMDAVRSLLGLNLSLGTLWNAIPWSFLIDYFVNVGDVLETTRNTLQFRATHPCIMTYTKQVDRHIVHYYGNGQYDNSGGGGTQTRETKQRLPLTTVLMPSFQPLLGAKQVSILGSLAIAKRNSWR